MDNGNRKGQKRKKGKRERRGTRIKMRIERMREKRKSKGERKETVYKKCIKMYKIRK